MKGWIQRSLSGVEDGVVSQARKKSAEKTKTFGLPWHSLAIRSRNQLESEKPPATSNVSGSVLDRDLFQIQQ